MDREGAGRGVRPGRERRPAGGVPVGGAPRVANVVLKRSQAAGYLFEFFDVELVVLVLPGLDLVGHEGFSLKEGE
jgi:hypothetical protein